MASPVRSLPVRSPPVLSPCMMDEYDADAYDASDFEFDYDSEYDVPRVLTDIGNHPSNKKPPTSRLMVIKAEHKFPKRPSAIASPTRASLRKLRAKRLSMAPCAKPAVLAEHATSANAAWSSRGCVSTEDLSMGAPQHPVPLPVHAMQRARSQPNLAELPLNAEPALLGASLRASGPGLLLANGNDAFGPSAAPKAARAFFDPTTGKQTFLRC